MLAATAKRSDRFKRQLFIYPRTEADSPLPARNWPSSHFLLHLLSLGRLRKMRSVSPRSQPTFFRNDPGEAGERGEKGEEGDERRHGAPWPALPFRPFATFVWTGCEKCEAIRIGLTFRRINPTEGGKGGEGCSRAIDGFYAAVEANGTLTLKRDNYNLQRPFAYKIFISEAEPLNFRHFGKPRKFALVSA